MMQEQLALLIECLSIYCRRDTGIAIDLLLLLISSRLLATSLMCVGRTVLLTVLACPVQPAKAVPQRVTRIHFCGNGVSNVKEVSSCCLLSLRNVAFE